LNHTAEPNTDVEGPTIQVLPGIEPVFGLLHGAYEHDAVVPVDYHPSIAAADVFDPIHRLIPVGIHAPMDNRRAASSSQSIGEFLTNRSKGHAPKDNGLVRFSVEPSSGTRLTFEQDRRC
jgi:hypothetical protein